MIIEENDLAKLKPLHNELYNLSQSYVEKLLSASGPSTPDEKLNKDLIIDYCHQLISLITLNLLRQSENDGHALSELTEEEQLNIVQNKSLFDIIDSSLKKISDNQELIKIGKMFCGRQASTENLNEYEKIFSYYDEIKEENGKSNYSLAVHRFARKNQIKYKGDIDKIYKRFMKFRSDNKLNSLADFQKYLSTNR
ncbi:hypothetical protein ACFLTH_11930 [Bacteroidota bacterium]